MLSILKNCTIDRVMNSVAAGTSSQNGTGVSMAAHETVTFIALLGALTATQVTELKAQQSDDDGSSDTYDDLAGTLTGPMLDADGNKILILEVNRPTKAFVRPVVIRGTANAVIDGVIAIRSHPRKHPTTQGTTVSASKTVVTPDEGTP